MPFRASWLQPPREACEEFQDLAAAESSSPVRSEWPIIAAPSAPLIVQSPQVWSAIFVPSDFDPVSGVLHVNKARVAGINRRSTKTGVDRQVVLCPRALAVLHRQLKLREQLQRTGKIDHDQLFFLETGELIRDLRQPYSRWRKTLKQLPMRYRKPYAARHSSVSWNLMANAGLVSLGHSAFWGIGSYATVLSMNAFGLPYGLGFVPAIIAANLQSWRKYVEHVGLTGSTVRGSTRSVVADDLWGRLVSLTLLHEPYHGVHHQRMSLPHAELPGYEAELEPKKYQSVKSLLSKMVKSGDLALMDGLYMCVGTVGTVGTREAA